MEVNLELSLYEASMLLDALSSFVNTLEILPNVDEDKLKDAKTLLNKVIEQSK